MTTDATPTPRIGAASWIIAALGTAYYASPLLMALVRPMPHLTPDVIAIIAIPAVVGLVSLVWLPRAPWAVAVINAALLALSGTAFGPALVACEHLSKTGRRWAPFAAVALFATGKAVWFAFSDQASPARIEFVITVTCLVIAALIGALIQAQERAEARAMEAQRAQQDASDARVNEARLAEREQIAREMHDVVAHRISLIALHSGALAHRLETNPDEEWSAEERAEASGMARLIQTNAQASLEELRGMLATLRDTEAPPEPPQPTLADIDRLVRDARDAGQQIELVTDGDLAAVPERTSRNAYRIAQEGLTNARKHAPGAPVRLELDAIDGVRVRVSNPLVDTAPNRSGSGLGLIGVVERVEQLGGDVTHGVQGREFVLDAHLPATRGARA